MNEFIGEGEEGGVNETGEEGNCERSEYWMVLRPL